MQRTSKPRAGASYERERISDLTLPKRFTEMSQTRKNFSYRVIPFLESGITDSDIWPDRLVHKFYGDPILAFALTSKEIADSYRQFFEALWKSAEKGEK